MENNKIVILGNGFDVYKLKLPTRWNDFITWNCQQHKTSAGCNKNSENCIYRNDFYVYLQGLRNLGDKYWNDIEGQISILNQIVNDEIENYSSHISNENTETLPFDGKLSTNSYFRLINEKQILSGDEIKKKWESDLNSYRVDLKNWVFSAVVDKLKKAGKNYTEVVLNKLSEYFELDEISTIISFNYTKLEKNEISNQIALFNAHGATQAKTKIVSNGVKKGEKKNQGELNYFNNFNNKKGKEIHIFGHSLINSDISTGNYTNSTLEFNVNKGDRLVLYLSDDFLMKEDEESIANDTKILDNLFENPTILQYNNIFFRNINTDINLKEHLVTNSRFERYGRTFDQFSGYRFNKGENNGK